MAFSYHATITALHVVLVLTVTAKAFFECNTRIQGDLSHRVAEATFARLTVRVAARTISFVHDRLGLSVARWELFGGNRRSVNVRQERSILVLFTCTMHGAKTTIVGVDVSVTTASIVVIA